MIQAIGDGKLAWKGEARGEGEQTYVCRQYRIRSRYRRHRVGDREMRTILLCTAALVAGVGVAADSRPAFVMRIDDNHSPADWRQVCGMFERHGFRCNLAVCAASLDESQGKCLKDLASRGHEILDHTPNHSLYSISYPDAASFERARRLPFAHDADEKTRRVLFDCVADAAHPSNRTIRARVSDGKLVVAKGKLRNPMYTFLKFASHDEVYGLSRDFSLLDFWKRKPGKPLEIDEYDVILFDQAALQPCDGLLRELASVARDGFRRHGIPSPRIWIRPGGWCPGFSQDAIERIYGREFGYVGADSRIGKYRSYESRWSMGYTAMYYFEQGAEITPEELLKRIEKQFAEGKDYILLTHMRYRKLPGKRAEWFEKTERFAQLLADRKIRVLTLSQLIEERFGKILD